MNLEILNAATEIVKSVNSVIPVSKDSYSIQSSVYDGYVTLAFLLEDSCVFDKIDFKRLVDCVAKLIWHHSLRVDFTDEYNHVNLYLYE